MRREDFHIAVAPAGISGVHLGNARSIDRLFIFDLDYACVL